MHPFDLLSWMDDHGTMARYFVLLSIAAGVRGLLDSTSSPSSFPSSFPSSGCYLRCGGGIKYTDTNTDTQAHRRTENRVSLRVRRVEKCTEVKWKEPETSRIPRIFVAGVSR